MKMRKLIAMLLTLCLALAILPVTALPVSAEESSNLIYLKPNDDWKKDGARFAAYFFTGGDSNTWVDLNAVEGDDSIYYAEIPAGNWEKVIMARMDGAKTENNWNNKWNQTGDIDLKDNNLIVITGWDKSEYVKRYAAPGWYVNGSFNNSWNEYPNPDYRLTLTEDGLYVAKGLSFATNDEFKIGEVKNGSAIKSDTYYPGGNSENNGKILEAGLYDVYFRVWNKDVEAVGGYTGWTQNAYLIRKSVTEDTLIGSSLSLEGDIGLNFYLQTKAGTAIKSAKMSSEAGAGEIVVNLEDALVTRGANAGQYKFAYPINAKEINKKVTITFYDGENATGNEISVKEDSNKELSVCDYISTVQASEDEKYSKVKPLVSALYNYGAYAAKTLNNYDPSLTLNTLDDAPTLNKEDTVTSTNTSESFKLTQMTLLLEDRTTIRIFFEATQGVTVAEKYNNYDVTSLGNNKYYVSIPNVSAYDLDTKFTVKLDDDCVISVSALNYVRLVLNNSSNKDELKNACIALYYYNQAANTYFGK